ncbi:MAG: prolyl oligopeptidase family serine peptidase [Bacteroidota bacterium]
MNRLLLTLAVALAANFLFCQHVMTPETLWKLKRLSGGKVSPDGRKVLYEIRTFSIEENKGNTDLFVYDLKKGTETQVTTTPFSEMEAQWGKGNKIWFLSTESKSVQLWNMDESGANKKQVSSISEVELEGFRLSPDETKIVFVAAVKIGSSLKDKHPDLPLANARLEGDLMYRHWNAWSDEMRRHLFLFDITNNEVSIANTDLLENESYDGVLPPFGGADQLVFSPDSKKIVYSTKKKRGKQFALSTNSQLYEYTIDSHTTVVLTNDYKGYDASPRYSADGRSLFWQSMARDGFEADKNNIIMRDLASGTDINLTQKHDITVDDYCLSPDGKTIYLLVPYMGMKQLFALTIQNQELKQITKGEFDYLSLDLTGDQLIGTRQSMLEPTDLVSVDIKSGKEKKLTNCNEDILKKLDHPSVQQRWVETSDGKKMLVWLVLPPNFDSNKKYPSILYCQGGPQSMVSQFYSYRWNLALMASQGYIVIAPNRRGLPGFGQQWNDDISKDWGGQAIRDYLSAVDNISNEPFIDVNRIGAVGASYGGYSVYYLAGVHNGRFKTFISHCGLFNLESWYGTTEELFFANWDNKGPYWMPENKEYYEKNSPHKLVNNWNTPILVIHGGMDFRVPESEGMQAYQAAQIKGLRTKYLYFPKEGHWISTPQNGILWYREFFEWLDTDLKK